MRKSSAFTQAALVACCIIALGAAGLRYIYADRVFPGTYIGAFPIGGMKIAQLPGALTAYQQQLDQTPVHITFRGRSTVRTFGVLGITVDQVATVDAVIRTMRSSTIFSRMHMEPVLAFRDKQARALLLDDFAQVISLPKDAALHVDEQYNVAVVQGASGEDIDMIALDKDITHVAGLAHAVPVVATAMKADPAVQAGEMQQAQQIAQELLQNGFRLTYNDETYTIRKNDIAAMLAFAPVPVPHVAFDSVRLQEYIQTVIQPKVHVEPVNARFRVENGIVAQFALPKNGTDVDVDATVRGIANALMQGSATSAVIAKEITPLFADTKISDSFGIEKLLATGETNFRGSPRNRVHNVGVGADRFNGILLAPGEEFSFNKLLGPVDAEAGYLPELVIKNNATIPEYGGGLCQVSTTAFRTAMLAGLKITERHNHSYAVAYYGTPGFDATIYPPYTDLRFLNNTPGYLLIQTHIDGTKLSFEFWGTDDGRQSVIDGPHPYDRMPDGSVKAILKRTVTDANGQVIEDNTFRSNYKSPKLFPHESAAKQSTNASASATGADSTNGNA